MENVRYDYLEERYRNLVMLGNKEKKSTYLAQDSVSGQIVVKKYVQLDSAKVYERMISLQSPHLVPIFHVAESERTALVIMEYVSGRTIEDLQKDVTLFSEEETADYVGQLLKALAMLHDREIIHRDINPKNVLISTDGVVKLLDFDIGRQYKKQQGSDTTILGTVGYAAPEQFGFTQSDKRTDIYAVGILMNVMLTGCLPKEKLYTKGRLGDIIYTCTQIDPDKRYQQIEEIQGMEDSKEAVARTKKEKSIWPGFRTGKIWKKLIATVYYFFVGIYSVLSVSECAKTPLAGTLEFIAVVMYLWLSALLPLNFLHWMDKAPGVKRLETYGRVVLGILLWIVLFYNGIRLDNYVRIDLLHIAIRK